MLNIECNLYGERNRESNEELKIESLMEMLRCNNRLPNDINIIVMSLL